MQRVDDDREQAVAGVARVTGEPRHHHGPAAEEDREPAQDQRPGAGVTPRDHEHRRDHREAGGDVDAAAELPPEAGRVERRTDRAAVVERLPERHPGDLRSLYGERDPAAAEHQHRREREELIGPVGLAQVGHLASLGLEPGGDRREHREPEHEAADHQQKAGEVRKPCGQVRPVDRRRLGGGRLRRGPALADPEREHPRDQVPVGRDDPPAHRVVAVGQAGLERDHEVARVRGRAAHRACRHRAALGVHDIGSFGDRLHRLVESEHHLGGWLGDDALGLGRGREQGRVRQRRGGQRGEHEHHDQHTRE